MGITVDFKGAQVELIDLARLAMLHNKTVETDTFVLDTFFPNRISLPGKDGVNVGDLDTVQPLAPFVKAEASSRTIRTGGSVQTVFVPAAYLKPNVPITPNTVYDTALLEMLREAGAVSRTGQISDAEKLRVAQTQAFINLRKSVTNRKTLMAIDVLTTGKTVYSGDDYEHIEVDYGRDANLTWTPGTGWDQSGANIVTDIETMISRMVDTSGVSPSVILTSSKVYNTMVKNAEVKDRIIEAKASTEAPQLKAGLADFLKPVYRGALDGSIQIWTYDAKHRIGGAATRFIAEDAFYLIADTSGYQVQCGIKHLDAVGEPLEFFDYMVSEKDPSVLKMITESAPVIAPGLVNGVIGGTGFIA